LLRDNASLLRDNVSLSRGNGKNTGAEEKYPRLSGPLARVKNSMLRGNG